MHGAIIYEDQQNQEAIATKIIEKAIDGMDYASLIHAHGVKLTDAKLDEVIANAALAMIAKKFNDYEGRKHIRDAVDDAITKECQV